MGFIPTFTITSAIAMHLLRIERVREAVHSLPITALLLTNLRESARLVSTHYSTMIEGNLLTGEQVAQVISHAQHFPGRECDQDEVRGYYAAIDEVDHLTRIRAPISELTVQTLHALVMGAGMNRVKPSEYRDAQNVIRDSRSNRIVYLPPEAQDVPLLMRQLVDWINHAKNDLPVPLKAAIAHYQYATVHPYYDGNGRTARLLTTLILHLGDYGLKGLYALEEYYARDLSAYCTALTVGPSHNYYLGRATADITAWVAYFTEGMALAFEKVHEQAKSEAQTGRSDQSKSLRNLNAKQRKALTLFQKSKEVTARDLAALFSFQPRTASALCQDWVDAGFLVVADPAKKSRRYRLADVFEARFH